MSPKKADNLCDTCHKEFTNGLLNWEYELEKSSLYCNKCYRIFLERLIRASGTEGFAKEKAEIKLDSLKKWTEEHEKYL